MTGGGITEAHWEYARSLDLEEIAGVPVLGSYITGSLAAGLGTPTSDLDVIAVTAAGEPAATWHAGPDFVCHVDVVTEDDLLGVVGRLGDVPLPSARYDEVGAYLPLCRRLPRLVLGQALTGAERVSGWQAAVDVVRLRQLVLTHACVTAITFVRDAHGALAAGNLLAAHEAAATALRWAMHGALATASDVYFGEKWITTRWARAEAIDPETRAAVLDTLLTRGPLGDPAEARAAVEARLAATRDLTAYASLFGFGDAAPPWPPSVLHGGGGENAEACAPFADGVILGGTSAMLLNRLDALVLFYALRATSFDGLREDLRAVTGQEVPEAFVRAKAERLGSLPMWNRALV